jgi:Pin2-interacting protein X1
MEAPKQRFQGIQKVSAGYRLLKSMGWEEGEGLGAAKQGIKEHIRVKKNFENWGVGAISAAERARDWSTGMVEFHRVLSNLSEITSSHARGEEGSEKEGSVGRTSKKRSREKSGEPKSKKVTETKTRDRNLEIKEVAEPRKGLVTGATGDFKLEVSMASPAKAKAPKSEENHRNQRQKTATHIGRFKKRESAKVVKNYSAHDLAAILGVHETDAFPSFQPQTGEGSETPDSNSPEQCLDTVSERDANEEPRRSLTQSSGMAVTSTGEDSTGLQGEKQWWSDYFVCAGRMGSLNKGEKKKSVGFSEQDQTDLYNETNKGATQGRVGLGRSSMPKKVAGARWQGKKTKLDDGSDEEMDQEMGGDMQTNSLLNLKWKKILKKMLRGKPKGIKLKELQRVVMEHYSLSKTLASDLEAMVLERVKSSSKYSLHGKLIKLVPKIPV